MRKVSFYIFNYVSTFILFMCIETSLWLIFGTPKSIGDYFFYVFFAIGWISVFIRRVSYSGKIITEYDFARKKEKKFSEVVAIEKLNGRSKTLSLIFCKNESETNFSSYPMRIEYAFQKKQLIKMIEKILLENPKVTFINRGLIQSKEEFFNKL